MQRTDVFLAILAEFVVCSRDKVEEREATECNHRVYDGFMRRVGDACRERDFEIKPDFLIVGDHLSAVCLD